MAEWIYFIRPPREDFVATITDEESAIMRDQHFPHLARLYEEGSLILAGPTFGPGMDDGITVLEAETEELARAIMESDPAITSGLMTGELRPMRVTFLRGRYRRASLRNDRSPSGIRLGERSVTTSTW